jgi:cell division initiation protein
LRSELEFARAELERTRTQEGTLKETLVMAQKAADDTRAAAQRHAENVIEEARQGALAEKIAAQQQLSEMRWQIEQLKVERQKFTEEFRLVLERYLREVSFVNPLTVVEGDDLTAASA